MKYFAVTVTSCGISWFITSRINIDGFLGLFLYAAVAVAVPLSMYILLFRKNEYFKDTLGLASRLLPMGNKQK